MIDATLKHIYDTLKPCPFCGASAFLWRVSWGTCIECSKYHVDKHRIMVSAQNDKDAAERWNRRANDSVEAVKWDD